MSIESSLGDYPLLEPDDVLEGDRLDIQHQIFKLTLNDALTAAPLDSQLTSILDLGCGTGAWTIEIARAFPSAHVTATDVTLPRIAAPTNVTFVKADMEQPWQVGSFAFIHGRMIMAAVKDWPALLRKCWDHLEPGGWLELLEMYYPFESESLQEDSSTSSFLRYGEYSHRVWDMTGRDCSVALKQPQWLQELGFENIKSRHYRWAIGPWGGTERERKIGELLLKNTKMCFASSAAMLARLPGVSQAEAETLIQGSLKDIEENGVAKRYYFNAKVHTAQKPLNPDSSS